MTNEEKTSVLDALKGMMSFFTMLPIDVERRHMDSMNKCFWLIPVIGLFYGILSALVFVLTSEYVSRTIAAAMTILLIGTVNRFLHLDGTIDVGDGLTVAGAREDHLRALKDTTVGAGGVAFGSLVVLLTFSEYLSLSSVGFLIFGISTEILARNAQVSAAAFGTPGNGMAGGSVRHTGVGSLVLSTLLTSMLLIAVLSLSTLLIDALFDVAVGKEYAAGIAGGFLAAPVWGYFVSRLAERNFGMVNGDVLGATNETGRAVVLFVMISIMSIMKGI